MATSLRSEDKACVPRGKILKIAELERSPIHGNPIGCTV